MISRGQIVLKPRIGFRLPWAHGGGVIAPASNQRRSSNGLERRLGTGEVVGMASAIGISNREITLWPAASANEFRPTEGLAHGNYIG